jgi:hypothetical protein
MIDISNHDRKRIVRAIEYLVEHGDNRTVEMLCDECGVTFGEYRVICDIAMPAIRQHADVIIHKHRAAFYKGRYNRKLKEAEMLLKKYQDGGTIDESDLHLLAAGEREDFVSASYQGDDGEEGHPEEWAI